MVWSEQMTIKRFWDRCSEFVVEEQDAFLIEANSAETTSTILPNLSPHEKLKFDKMKEVYVARTSNGGAHEGCFYFLVSRDAQSIKFESVALLTADLSGRVGKVKVLPDISIAKIEEVSSIDPDAY